MENRVFVFGGNNAQAKGFGKLIEQLNKGTKQPMLIPQPKKPIPFWQKVLGNILAGLTLIALVLFILWIIIKLILSIGGMF